MSRKNQRKATAKQKARRAAGRRKQAEFEAGPPVYVRTPADRKKAALWARKMTLQ